MTRTLESLLDQTLQKKASDLHLKVGRPPLFRIHGELIPDTEQAPFDSKELESILFKSMPPSHQQNFVERMEVDFAYKHKDQARFRVNVFRQQGNIGGVLRHIPLAIPAFDQLGLPPVLKELVTRKQGMILVTGPTGSGKSTTLAAMIDHLNRSVRRHVVTVEDPIEFVYADDQCVINQRELGVDTHALMNALKMALRQDPDVILMGEMRDLDSMEMGMVAAETGHILLSTLHTNDAKQSIDRILDTFPPDKVKPLRTLLSQTLLAVVSQRLIPTVDGKGRVAAVEVMINSPHVQELIEEGKVAELDEAIKSSDKFYHMQSFNQSLAKLARMGVISEAEALNNSTNPGDLRLMLRGVQMGSMGLSA